MAKPKLTEAASKLEELAGHAAQEDEAQGFMNPVKKKRGRKSNEEKAQENQSSEAQARLEAEKATEANKLLARPFFQALSSLGGKLAEDKRAEMIQERSPKFPNVPCEMEIMVDTAAACIQQYLPDAMGKHANLILLSATLGQWSFRVWLIRQENLARYRQQAEAQGGGGGSGLRTEMDAENPHGKPVVVVQ